MGYIKKTMPRNSLLCKYHNYCLMTEKAGNLKTTKLRTKTSNNNAIWARLVYFIHLLMFLWHDANTREWHRYDPHINTYNKFIE